MKIFACHSYKIDFLLICNEGSAISSGSGRFFFPLLFCFIYIYLNVTTMFSQQCKIDPQPSLYKKKKIFSKEIKVLCQLTGATRKQLPEYFFLMFLPLILCFGHSYIKTDILQLTHPPPSPLDFLRTLKQWLSQRIYTSRHKTLFYLAHLPLSNTDQRTKKWGWGGGGVLLCGNDRVLVSWIEIYGSLSPFHKAFNHTSESIRGNKGRVYCKNSLWL